MIWVLRILLLVWLTFSVKLDDDLYGVRWSMINFEKCRRVIIRNY